MSDSNLATEATSQIGAPETPTDSNPTPSTRRFSDDGGDAALPDPNRPDNRFRAMPVVRRGSRDKTTVGPPLGVDPARPVLTLQTWLNRGMDAGLVGDGDFGPATEATVRSFQQFWSGLLVDGVVGRQTWSQLDVALDLLGK
jgi:peptidoglycan hydrolase-like protein with peptidoglycan-binding domain